jgi:hypothetical protein
MLSFTQGNQTSILDKKNSLILTNGNGSKWNSIMDFPSVNGIILSSTLSDFNHTVLSVEYNNAENSNSPYFYVDGKKCEDR